MISSQLVCAKNFKLRAAAIISASNRPAQLPWLARRSMNSLNVCFVGTPLLSVRSHLASYRDRFLRTRATNQARSCRWLLFASAGRASSRAEAIAWNKQFPLPRFGTMVPPRVQVLVVCVGALDWTCLLGLLSLSSTGASFGLCPVIFALVAGEHGFAPIGLVLLD